MFSVAPVSLNTLDGWELTTLLLFTSLVHEWFHHEMDLEERAAVFATEQTMRAIVDSLAEGQVPFDE